MSEMRLRRSRPAGTISTAITSINLGPVKRADTSRQMYQEDEFEATITSKTWLNPPYKPDFIDKCRERSNMLNQCIAAMVTNVGLCGFEVVPVDPKIPMDDAEREELESFIEWANSEESLTTVHAKVVDDYEGYGYGFVEAIRDRKGGISMFRHVKAGTMRLMPKEATPIKVSYAVGRGRRVSYVTEYRTFRRFVQIVNGKYRYFKEFGDPRPLDMDTGEFGKVSRDKEATEIIHIKQQSNEPYGIPRWINQLPSVLGSRESEECNLRYFEDNTVPPAILSVAGGRLTAASHRELQRQLQQQGIGKERQNKILLIEAVPERESLDDKSATVQIKLDKLSDARQSDGLFKEYDEANQAKIRSSFRLPPVAVGLSQDVTFATANVSAYIAESQVYQPARGVYDEVYNKRLVQSPFGLSLRTCKIASRVPSVTNSETLMKSLTALNVMGALTPRIANETANKVLGVDIAPYPEKGTDGWEEWMDKPIIFVTKGTASDAGQAQKTENDKQTEANGNVAPNAPEHGQE